MRYTSSFLEHLSARAGDAVLHAGRGSITGGEILDQARAIARMLEARGVRPGDVAIVLLEPGPLFLAIVYATMMSGMTLALLDPEMGPANLRAKLAQLQPAVAFVDSRLLLLQEHPLVYGPARKWFQAPYVPSLRGTLIVAAGPWLPILRRHVRLPSRLANDTATPPAADADLPRRTGEFVVTYTSGTLAEPKGVVHSVEGLEASIRHVAAVLGDPDAQRIATHLPHYMLLGICAGIPVFVWKHRWPAARKLRFIQDNGITTLFGPPSDFLPLVRALEEAGRRFPNSLRLVLLGSAPVYASFLRRLQALLPAHTRVVCMYGMTENLLVSTASLADKLAFAESGDFVGRPVDGIELKIDDDGELLVRSPQSYVRYFHESTRETWHRTGDLARRRADGSIVLLGRRKDMIIRGNFNLYPALYESTVCRIDGVAAAAFVGVYDESRADEVVHLVVEPADAAAARSPALGRRIAAALKDGECAIDRQAFPDRIWLMTLPRSGRSQKVDRRQLRDQLRRAT